MVLFRIPATRWSSPAHDPRSNRASSADPSGTSAWLRRRALFRGGLLGLGLLALSVGAEAVGTRYFVVQSGKEFAAGELEGVAVDSEGQLRPGLALADQEIPGVTAAWAAVEHRGVLYVGTGNEGKLIRVREGQSEVAAEAEVMALTALASAWGELIVGSMPGGRLYRLEGDKLVEFAKLEDDEHVWALSFDDDRGVLFAATGPHGRLYRVTRDGTAQVYFEAEQSHLVSVKARANKVYAGSSGEALLYEVTGPGRAEVVFDFGVTEVRAIAVADDGVVFAIANELKGGPRSDSIKPDKVPAPSHSSASAGKGQLFRFESGAPSKMFEDDEAHFVSLTVDDSGLPVVGTGAKGKIYRVDRQHQSALLAEVDERQVTSVLLDGATGWVVGSDPVVAHRVTGQGSAEALWTSEVLDAGIRASFGKMDWEGEGKVLLSTRSGNTSDPNQTWSDWSQDMSRPGLITSPQGRFLQVRARLMGEDAVLRRIELPFVTDNLRAIVTKVSTESPVLPKASEGLEKSGGPIEGEASSTVEIDWKVDNPDDDELRYFVEYQLLGGSDWFDALEPSEVLTRPKLSWDTSDLPEGRYRVRVTATDELSNPPSEVTRHVAVSDQVLVDNTAPTISGLTVRGRQVVGVARDGIGPIRRIEVRAAGEQRWVPYAPRDGIFDEAQEEFALDLAPVVPQGSALVTVRVFDSAGNFTVEHVKIAGKAKP